MEERSQGFSSGSSGRQKQEAGKTRQHGCWWKSCESVAGGLVQPQGHWGRKEIIRERGNNCQELKWTKGQVQIEPGGNGTGRGPSKSKVEGRSSGSLVVLASGCVGIGSRLWESHMRWAAGLGGDPGNHLLTIWENSSQAQPIPVCPWLLCRGKQHIAGSHWMSDCVEFANYLECKDHKSTKMAHPSLECSQTMLLFAYIKSWVDSHYIQKRN